MRTLLLALALLPLAGCGALRSTVGIEPGETFVLGGEQSGAFTAELLNVGAVPIGVARVTVSGDTVLVATLTPGDGSRVRFAAGSAALLVNRSAQEAAVQAVIRGDTDLGMRYTPTE